MLAYCEELLSGPAVAVAAADAFSRFRREVIAAERLDTVNPEALLLRGTRRAALDRAPTGDGGRSLRDVVRGRRATCDLVPDLLAAHAEELLSEDDEERLARHLSACAACNDLAERFMRAEHAYRDPPARAMPEALVNTIVAAMAATAGDEAIGAPAPNGANGDASRSRVTTNGATAHAARPRRPVAQPDEAPTVVVPALEPYPTPRERERRRREPAITSRLLSGDFAVSVLIPAAVVGAGVIVTLAIAGVFSSSEQRGPAPQTPNTLPATRLAPTSLVAASHAPASSVPEELARAAELAAQKRREAANAARVARARQQAASQSSDTGAAATTTVPTAETTPPTQSAQKTTPTQKHYSVQKDRNRTTKRPPPSTGPGSGTGTGTGTGPQTTPGGTPGL